MFIIWKKYSNILKKKQSLRGQTVLWIGAQLWVSKFQRQVLKHVPKSEWIPRTKLQWIPRTNACNVNFVGTLILLWIPQRANIGGCSGFRKCKRIPQMYVDSANLRGFRLQFADSALNLRTPLTVADSATA